MPENPHLLPHLPYEEQREGVAEGPERGNPTIRMNSSMQYHTTYLELLAPVNSSFLFSEKIRLNIIAKPSISVMEEGSYAKVTAALLGPNITVTLAYTNTCAISCRRGKRS